MRHQAPSCEAACRPWMGLRPEPQVRLPQGQAELHPTEWGASKLGWGCASAQHKAHGSASRGLNWGRAWDPIRLRRETRAKLRPQTRSASDRAPLGGARSKGEPTGVSGKGRGGKASLCPGPPAARRTPVDARQAWAVARPPATHMCRRRAPPVHLDIRRSHVSQPNAWSAGACGILESTGRPGQPEPRNGRNHRNSRVADAA